MIKPWIRYTMIQWSLIKHQCFCLVRVGYEHKDSAEIIQDPDLMGGPNVFPIYPSKLALQLPDATEEVKESIRGT